jgi:ubiquinone/menaquinone biosynthesis C-methylase UbiE
MARRDWTPVAPGWERNPEDTDLWRRVATMPSLALNAVELDLLMPVAGKNIAVLGVGQGLAALALAALGGRVTAVDPSTSYLDMLMVRAQLVGVEVAYRECELDKLAVLADRSCGLVYAAGAAPQVKDLELFYREVRRALVPGGRLVVNEYHPVRRIWKQEPGAPRAKFSYFDRVRPIDDEWQGDATVANTGFCQNDYQWTVADHFNALCAAGLRVVALEEVGEVRQQWEVPNLKGLPEQLVIAAERRAGR